MTTKEIFRIRNKNLHLIPKGNEPIEVSTTIDLQDQFIFNLSFEEIKKLETNKIEL